MVRALEAAGPELTPDGFIKAMEGLTYDDKLMGASVDCGADHLGSSKVFISRIEGRSWKVIGTAGDSGS